MTPHYPVDKVLQARRAYWRAQSGDPLAKRQRTAAFWKACNETNPHYGLVHARAFYRNAGFREFVLPCLRAFLTAREKAAEAAWRAELRESARRHTEQKALAKASPLPLFEGVS